MKMKAFVLFMATIIAVISCSKDNDSPKVIADKFVGDWTVGEDSQNGANFNSSIFYSSIFKVNDSTFGINESNRTPIPMWIYWPNFLDYRTIHL